MKNEKLNAHKNCAALVPAFNEAARIEGVLSTLLSSKLFKKIVVIDDGSTDKTSQVVKEKFPDIILLRLDENQGKAAAVKKGLNRIDSKYTFLCDADLKNLKSSEITQALELITSKNGVKMIILKRVNEIDHLLTKSKRLLKMDLLNLGVEFKPKTLDKVSCLLSGERVLETKLLSTILEEKDVKGYELEVTINQYLLEHNLKGCWLPSQALGSLKIDELGILPFLNKYISMHFNLIHQLGTKKYLRQLDSFCNEQCPKIDP